MNSHDPNDPDTPDTHADTPDRDADASDARPDALESELLALGALLDVPPAAPATDMAATVRARLTQPDPSASASPDPALPASPDPGVSAQPDPVASARPDPDVPVSPDPGAPARPDPGVSAPPHPHVPAAPADPVREARGSRRPGGRQGRRRRRWGVVVAVVAVVVAITAATPQGRAAVVKILRFAGVELRVSDTPPPPLTTTAPLPGERTVAPEELPALARFPVRTPTRLGPPRTATVSDGGRVVSMFWPDGIRLDQFDGEMSPYFFKQLGPPFPTHVELDGGAEGWWVGGEHPLGYLRRADGTAVPLRQAAPTLIWTSGGVNHRLEGVRTAREAAEIAASLR
ncbi:hypothetical protein [Nonomuraea bangladeshensis]|uniref:hypothetical protein n=1 Tax=Nonomuraea bangladeshensis TaxID=404385 RepID=UPI0031DD33EB